jgi:hypothetical protein
MQTLEFAQRYPEVRWYCYGPGFVRTTLLRNMGCVLQCVSKTFGLFISASPEDAAKDILKLLRGEESSGLYVPGVKPNRPTEFRSNEGNRYKLWDMTKAIIDGARVEE